MKSETLNKVQKLCTEYETGSRTLKNTYYNIKNLIDEQIQVSTRKT